MIDKINSLLKRVEEFRPKAEAEIEEFRVRMLGRKGEMNELFEEFKQVAPELKKELGQRINALKNTIAETITRYKTEMENRPEAAGAGIDMTRPGTADRIGSRHPISLVRNQIVDIFTRLGYTVAEGPEIEDDWHVFSSLNFAFGCGCSAGYPITTMLSGIRLLDNDNALPIAWQRSSDG